MAEYDTGADNRIRLLAVVGPTASGKSALAVELAERLNGEVISCDSMQIYKGFTIATAVPEEEEMKGIPHHLISFADAQSSFSVAEYCTLARACIADITARGKLPVIRGGTGLYFTSLVEGIEFTEFDSDEELRRELEKRALSEGGEKLLEELAVFDSETAARLEPADRKRIIRAIEVYRRTGIPLSEHIRASRRNAPDYRLCAIGLNYSDREKLYDRINLRVDDMLRRGLLRETEEFFSRSPGATAVQAIGFKEMKPYLDGECSLDEAAENLKRATRRYAKRQLSWFRRSDYILWHYVDEYDDFDQLCDAAEATSRGILYGC